MQLNLSVPYTITITNICVCVCNLDGFNKKKQKTVKRFQNKNLVLYLEQYRIGMYVGYIKVSD